jgi:hypothetical protein
VGHDDLVDNVTFASHTLGISPNATCCWVSDCAPTSGGSDEMQHDRCLTPESIPASESKHPILSPKWDWQVPSRASRGAGVHDRPQIVGARRWWPTSNAVHLQCVDTSRRDAAVAHELQRRLVAEGRLRSRAADPFARVLATGAPSARRIVSYYHSERIPLEERPVGNRPFLLRRDHSLPGFAKSHGLTRVRGAACWAPLTRDQEDVMHVSRWRRDRWSVGVVLVLLGMAEGAVAFSILTSL